MAYLALLLAYSAAQIALGLWIGRRVRTSGDFFVAGRRLGPGLLFSTMLAANIGAGSTVGATGLGYRDGLSAVWWVGSAAAGSIVLALWIGPAMRRAAAEHGLRTVGDFLELRFGVVVRTAIAALLWAGSLFILAGQLIATATILQVVVGVPIAAGCAFGGLLVTIYFTAGGLLTSAWVNVVQLTVKLLGFALALPLALAAVGGGAPCAACSRRLTTGTSGRAGTQGSSISRCSGRRSSSRRGCCRRSTARATTARSAWASAPTPSDWRPTP
jgi:SSS family solute:Na+ symporter